MNGKEVMSSIKERAQHGVDKLKTVGLMGCMAVYAGLSVGSLLVYFQYERISEWIKKNHIKNTDEINF